MVGDEEGGCAYSKCFVNACCPLFRQASLQSAIASNRYQDIGEEDDWTTADRDSDHEGDAPGKADDRKRKDGPAVRVRLQDAC